MSKKNSYFFSNHASDQLHSRSSLKRGDVLALLATRSCVPVGLDKHRVHTVIYSLPDRQPLVVVHDKKNLEIVTILYFDYNNKFVIDPSTIKQAEKLAERHQKHIAKMALQKTQKDRVPPVDSAKWIAIDPNIRQIKEDPSTLVELYLSTSQGEKTFYSCTFGELECNTVNIHHIPDLKEKIGDLCLTNSIKPEEVYGIYARIGYRKPLKFGLSKEYSKLMTKQDSIKVDE